MNKRTKGEKIFAVFNTIGLLLLCVICILPVWHVAMGSISDPLKVSATSGLYFFPLGTPTLGGYHLIFQNSTIVKSYGNTIFYVVTATSIGLILNILAAYCLSKTNLAFNKQFSLFVMFTMIFNGGLIPTYLVVKKLGMINTRWCMLIPMAIMVFNLIIVRTSFISLPDSLEQFLQCDGFFQEVDGTDAGGFDSGVDGGMTRHHDDRHGQVAIALPFLQQGDTIRVRHPDIEENQVRGSRHPRFPGLLGILSGLYNMPFI